jgi:hypothetical protein
LQRDLRADGNHGRIHVAGQSDWFIGIHNCVRTAETSSPDLRLKSIEGLTARNELKSVSFHRNIKT